jgi:hypothetical protein
MSKDIHDERRGYFKSHCERFFLRNGLLRDSEAKDFDVERRSNLTTKVELVS